MPDLKNYESLSAPATNGFAVTAHDTNELTTPCRVLYVGTGGVLKLKTLGGETLTLVNVPDGAIIPIRTVQVFATDTTCANMVALY